MKNILITSLTLAGTLASSHAALIWQGMNNTLFQESNWYDDVTMTSGGVTVDQDTAIADQGTINFDNSRNGTNSNNFGGGDLDIGNNHLIVSGGLLLQSNSTQPDTQLNASGNGQLTVTGGATVNISPTGTNDGLIGFNGTTGGITVDNGTLISTNEINVGSSSFYMLNNAIVSTGNLRIFNSNVILNSGTFTLNGSNPLQTGVGVSVTNNINITAAAGDFSLIQTDLSDGYNNRDLAAKLAVGFFSLDGVYIDPDGNGFTQGVASESDVADLNVWLLTNGVVNNKALQFSDNSGGQRVLSVVSVPEPSSTALLGLAWLGLLIRRSR